MKEACSRCVCLLPGVRRILQEIVRLWFRVFGAKDQCGVICWFLWGFRGICGYNSPRPDSWWGEVKGVSPWLRCSVGSGFLRIVKVLREQAP